MDGDIAYSGSIWGQNLGDRAIYYANIKMFSGFTVVPDRYAEDSPITMIGGGTVLPRALQSSYSLTDPIRRQYNFCNGVGVTQPEFWNQKRGKYDIRRYAGKRDIDIVEISSTHIGLKYFSKFVDMKLGDNVNLYGRYYTKKDFELVDNFGFDAITVRGPLSKRVLDDYGIESKITGDPALILEPDSYDYDVGNEIIVSLREPGGNKWDATNRYVEEVIDFCKQVSDDYQITLLPINRDDIPVHQKIRNEVENAELEITHHLQVTDVMNTISEADVMIGERLHASVLAAACHTPFISLEYQPKNRDFAKSIGFEDFNVRVDEVTRESLAELLESIETERDDVISDLKNEVELKRDALMEFSEEVHETIN